MTSKTSFFNKGIYKSTVKRYLWGSILYFIILFFSTGLSLFLNVGRGVYGTTGYNYFRENPLIFQGSYIGIPILMAIVVPTVATLLIFRFLHSKKQAIFTHSLPVSRKAIFNSSLVAGFTLMLVPVILNGIILIGISLCEYGAYFTVMDCFKWIGYNALGIFMMFSCAVFAANLTGNSFAMVALNGLVHGFLFLTVSTFAIMAEAFVYGFTEMNYFVERVAESNFLTIVFGFSSQSFRENLTALSLAEYIIASILLYAASYFLYKKRRMETAGDVAGFKCLNPIFKYIVTFLATMFGFAVFADYMGANPVVFAVIIAVISLVAYTASEMLLKKTFNVLYSWKGYALYAVLFVGMICFFALTSFFGYETRIPETSNIEEATVYEFYSREEPYTDNAGMIETTLAIHKEFVDGYIPKINEFNAPHSEMYTRIHIKYKLKNGGELTRTYPVSYETRNMIMNRLYMIEEYKKMCEGIFVDDSKITRVFINYETEVEGYQELLEAVRKDVLSLSYEELYPMYYNQEDVLYNISVEHEFEEIDSDGKPYSYLNRTNVNITEKHKNTLKWLDENGYDDEIDIVFRD